MRPALGRCPTAPPTSASYPKPGAPSDIVYLTGFPEGWYEVADALRVEWDADVLPYVWMWQELGAWRDYPWWGEAYVVGLEPFSSFPTNGLAEAVGERLGTARGGQRQSVPVAAGDGDGGG